MKNQFYLLVLLTFLSYQSVAQITITQNEFPRTANFTDVNYQSFSTIVKPAEGANQTWDYTAMTNNGISIFEYTDATGDPDFPNALQYRTARFDFQGYGTDSRHYETIDANGWYSPGSTILGEKHSLEAVTGNSADTLAFPARAMPFTGRIDYLQFPATYGSQWMQTALQSFHFELTVAAFGLNKTPGTRERQFIRSFEVVGHGDMSIPTNDGSASAPMPSLMFKSKLIFVDSFFVNGSPAPQPLLSAFGLTQGDTIIGNDRYLFYRQGFSEPLLIVNLDENDDVSSVFYRSNGALEETAIKELIDFEVNYFPNPVQAGKSLNVETENFVSSGSVQFFDLTGRLVYETAFNSGSGHQFELKIPTEIGKGLHFCLGQDQEGNLFRIGKIQID